MKKRNAYTIAGGLIGFFVGSSVGIAYGGDAVNGSWIVAFLGAFIGWLIGNSIKPPTVEVSDEEEIPANSQSQMPNSSTQNDSITSVISGALELIASVWNLHIDLLRHLNLLNYFCENSWPFWAMALAISILFPPFAIAYFVAFLCAAQLGANKDNQYKAPI